MMDVEAVAVTILAAQWRAFAVPDVDISQQIPCLIVETVSSAPINGPVSLASQSVVQVAAFARTRAQARDLGWEAMEFLDAAAGTVTDWGSLAHVAIEQVPAPVPPQIPIPDLFRFDFVARMTLQP